MNRVAELEKAVSELNQQEYSEFRQRFFERDWQNWDSQIIQDSKSGNLGILIQEAHAEKARKQLKPL